jgi:hypothetical protein
MGFIFGWYIVQVKKVFESAEHNFPVPERTYLVCDRDYFGVIKRKTKETVAVYGPESWGDLVEPAKSKKPFKGVRMTQEKHSVSISQFANILNSRSKDVHGQSVRLRRAARIIRVYPGQHPRKMSVGYTLNMFEILQEVNAAKTGRASCRGNGNNLPILHCERRRI